MVDIPINFKERQTAASSDKRPEDGMKEAELKKENLESAAEPKPSDPGASAGKPEAAEAETAAAAGPEKEPRPADAEGSGSGPAEADNTQESEIEELKKKINELEKKNQEMREQVLRVRAEADNFRKRMQKEKDDFARFAREGFIRELLPVKDNLERALAHAEEDPGSIVDGVRLTLEQFDSILKSMGVEPVESLGQPFDPSLHEAMAQVESDECEPNTVVNELQKGYTLHGRLLRPAMVAVAKAKSQEN